TLRHLTQRLGLRFDHQRRVDGAGQDLPTALDQELVSASAYARRALARHPNTADGFHEQALAALLATGPGDYLLNNALARLERPDVPNLPALIVRGLADRQSRGFGSLPIHGRLLLAQLEECIDLRPSLLDDRNFIATFLQRLRPGEDVAWREHPEVLLAYLERLEAFVQRLSPAHNSLEAHVLHHRL